jgi:hypothetical protein
MEGIRHIPKLNHLRHVMNILSCLAHVKLLSEGHRIDALGCRPSAAPGLEKRETWSTPGFPRSTFKDISRYTPAGDYDRYQQPAEIVPEGL